MGIAASHVFRPPDSTYSHDSPVTTRAINVEDLSNTKKIVKTYGHYLTGKKFCRESDDCKLIIYSHGNCGDLGRIYPRLKSIIESFPEVAILSYEYFGYGVLQKRVNDMDPAKPSAEGCSNCLRGAIKYAQRVLKIPIQNVFLYGRSLGSVPTIDVIANDNKGHFRGIGGIILESPFATLEQLAQIGYGSGAGRIYDASKADSWNVRRVIGYLVGAKPFDNIQRIKNVNCPVAIFHGFDDRTVPIEHGTALWKKVPKKCQGHCEWVPEASHTDIIKVLTMENYVSILKNYFTKAKEMNKILNEESDMKTFEKLKPKPVLRMESEQVGKEQVEEKNRIEQSAEVESRVIQKTKTTLVEKETPGQTRKSIWSFLGLGSFNNISLNNMPFGFST